MSPRYTRLAALAHSWYRDNKNVLLRPYVNTQPQPLTYDLDFQFQMNSGHGSYSDKN